MQSCHRGKDLGKIRHIGNSKAKVEYSIEAQNTIEAWEPIIYLL
jgi:hypothetical protein